MTDSTMHAAVAMSIAPGRAPDPFVEMVREFGMTNKVMVGSFSERTIQAFRSQCSEALTAASMQETRRLFIMNKLLIGRFYNGHAAALQITEFYGRRRVITSRFVKAAHKKKTAVHVWTVDEESDMERLIALGVDCIITDYPDRLLKLVAR